MTAFADFFMKLEGFADHEAMVWQDHTFYFSDILSCVEDCKKEFVSSGLGAGAVAAVIGDFTPSAVSTLLALFSIDAIAVPLTHGAGANKTEFCETSEVEWIINIDQNDQLTIVPTRRRASHELILKLRNRSHPGLILFTSGSTGQSKAVVHDMDLLLRKFLRPRHCYRTLAFMLLDHIGGIDTLFYCLANGSCLVTIFGHSPETVCAAIEKHRVEVLPISPTFINLLLLSGAHTRYDLSSLQIISYGAEVMPVNTLHRLQQTFPAVRLLQKFGTTEIGALRSISRTSDSLWVKLGGEGYQTRVVDDMLEIKADSAMLGYMNAPSPFTSDGWFRTGDAVDVDGEYMRILGRTSDIINVGGEKVYPAEVENVIQGMGGIAEVTVFGEKNPIIGNIVCARISLIEDEERLALISRLKKYCYARLARYKVPAKVYICEGPQYNSRFKKITS